ncbi:MAG: amidohydrolase [Gammaproteobacteria bacterium]
MNDSHLHPTRGGRFYNAELCWDGVPTLRGAVQMIHGQAARTPRGQWVRVVGGWSPEQFAERRMPTLDELNEAAPNTPVLVLYLYSRGFLNRAGLKALGIDRNSVAPLGGRFEKDADGEPTGLLIAAPNPTILYKTIAKLPPLSPEDQVNSSLRFYRELNRFGLTSVIDAAGGGHEFPEDYAASKRLAEQGKLSLRISYFLLPQKPGEELADFQRWTSETQQDQNEDRLRPNGYVLEGGGELLVAAAIDFENFMEPRPKLDPKFKEPLKQIVGLLVKKGYPFRIHATYDESISQMLEVFEAVNMETPFDGLRWALDHAETISPRNMDRVKALGGGIAVQCRLAYAGESFKERYPQQAASAPPIREMLKRGIPVGAGTDGTRVASYNPWISLYWLVTGKTVGGTQLASTDNRLSREEALQLYTVGSAWFSGEETLKGRIGPRQYADFAVLSADYFAVPEEEIKRIESVLTVVGGDVVYGISDFASLASPLPPTSPAWSPVSTYGGYYKGTK